MAAEAAAAAASEDFSSLPLDALLTHKNWKARREGFERVRDHPDQLKSYLLDKTRKLVREGNTAAQEALFEALAALVDVCDDDELNILAGEPLKLVVEKGVTGRPRAVQASCKFIFDLVGAAKQTEVFDVLLPAFSHKTPKNRLAAAQLCAQIVAEYGVAGLPTKSILKAMQPLFNDANAQVRKEAALLCCQCYKFIGAGIKGFLTDLREVQLQELEVLFEEVVLGEAPRRNIRGVLPSTPVKPALPVTQLVSHNGTSNDISDEAYELYDETPVLSRLPRNFYRVALDKTAKWQDRVAMVQDNLLPLIAAAKIRLKDDYHELAGMVRELLLDPQAPLMLLGFKCIQELARVLRSTFAPHARSFLNPLFDKMKDKKTSVVEHITTTLETLMRYRCITLEQCQDEIELTAQSRVPNQRLALIHWLIRLTDILDRGSFNRLGRAQGMLGRLMNDEKVEIREASCVLISKLITLLGEVNFQPLLASLDDKQRGKLATVINSAANLQCTPTISPAKKTQRLERRESAASVVVRSLSIGEMNTASLAGKSSRGQRHSSVMPRPSSPEVRKQHPVDDSVALESTLPSKEEALKRMLGLMNGNMAVLPLLRSKEWGSRQKGVMTVRAMIDGWTEDECTKYLDTVLVYLRVDPGWSESIFQVFHSMLGVIQELVTRATAVSAAASYAIIAGCTCRLTEPKNKAAVRELMTHIARRQGISFVIRHLIEEVTSVKTPRLMQECNEYMIQLLQTFSASQVDAKGVVDYVRLHCFGQQFPAVRSSGVMLLVALRMHTGAVVDNYISTLSPGLRGAYEEAIAQSNGAKVSRRGAGAGEIQRAPSPVSPSRMQKVESRNSARGGAGQHGTAPTAAGSHVENRAVGSLRGDQQTEVPAENSKGSMRADVSQQLIVLVKQITTASDWRTRLDGVKRVEEVMHANNKSIAPNMVTELLRALRTRFDEVNKNFVIDVLRTISLVVESAGPEACRPGFKSILQGVLGMLGDQKMNLRDEATNVAYVALDCLGLDAVLQCMLKPLTSESHACNQTALEIIERGFQREPDAVISRQGVISLVPAVVRLCMSRILEVRLAAERVIGKFIPLVGDDAVLRAVQSLRPAEQQSVMAPIERQVQLFLRGTNEEEGRRTSTFATLFSAQGPASCTPRSPRSPRAASRNMSVSHRSTDLSLPSQGGQLSLPASQRNSLGKEAAPSGVPLQASSSAPATQIAPPQIHNEELLSIQEIMVGLRSASASTAANTCAEFLKRIQNDEVCGTPEMIQVMVERLYENIKLFDAALALGLIRCLKVIFERPRFTQWCHSSLLFRMLGMIFDCLLSEAFSLHEEVIKALNNMTLTLLEGCPGNEVFSALMSRMARYSEIYTASGKKTDLKYIQVTVKCLMRLDIDGVSPDNVVLCCHEYLLQHPPSAFRNLDDLSIRTVKTILQDLSRRCGPPLLAVASRLVGTQNLVTHFVRACLENQERLARASSEGEQHTAGGANRQAQSHEPQQQRVVPPSQPGRLRRGQNVHVDPTTAMPQPETPPGAQGAPLPAGEEKSMSSIFARIRNHLTSNQGIEELYAFLKQRPKNPEFDQQFHRCSEAFRSYIKRKLERQMLEDTKKTPGFLLPEVLRSTP
ncbi:XMAP215 family protein [Trypanosoma conorhini]|uniref:XMAP215 family protein n=1 Tax=Trypanosoma conorhini TaxID=83891 RepID=A0A3R7L7I8_9TRYP|nr:XMAP215 family protein [Trypanosoma conorhini]RNF21334.1 XMAP215 family protein [Trypanosoma conorhini]